MKTTTRCALLLGVFLVAAPTIAGAQWIPIGDRYPYPYPMNYDNLRAAIRVEVDQKDAEVYVDGYYAGIVDDFDGTFQRLRATVGAHRIVVRLEGFHRIQEDVYLTPDVVYRIRRTMRPLAAGEPQDPRPEPMVPPDATGPDDFPPMQMPPDQRRPPDPRMPPGPPAPSRPADSSRYGTLVVRAQPDDAEILIDGEQWRGPEGDERLVVQLTEGRHRVEVRKAGFASFSTEIEIGRGETVPLNVSLSRQ